MPPSVSTPEDKRLQELAQLESYRRTYEAYKDSQSYQAVADRAVRQIELLANTAHPDVAERCQQFLESIAQEAEGIPDAIADRIAAEMQRLEVEG